MIQDLVNLFMVKKPEEVKISSKCILALRLSNSEFFKASDAMVKAAGL